MNVLDMFAQTLCPLLLLGLVDLSLQNRELNYDYFEQINGTDIIDFQLRVRKLNRTTSILTGEVIVRKPMTEDYLASVQLFHSPKGNNQFNHYPMKIPPSSVCTITRDIWPDYEKYFAETVENLFLVDECPVKERTMVFGNVVAHPDMLSSFVPAGLWKAILHVYTAEGEGFSAIMQLKLLQDGYF